MRGGKQTPVCSRTVHSLTVVNNMKKPIFMILSFLIFQSGISQNISDSDLIGEWNFIELQDENGKKQTKIPLIRFGKNRGVEKVNRDSYMFNQDKTYKSFNPLNVSTGTWFFDKKKNEINLELIISPDNVAWEYLKKIVKKRKDGKYYQTPVQQRILYFEKDSMVIADRLNYILIYKRK